MKVDDEILQLAFQIGVVYDEYSVEKKEKVAEMIAKWHEKRRWKSAFKDLQRRVNFDLDCD